MRDGTWFVVLEAHAVSATLYLQGALGTREAEKAVALCALLPSGVRNLRVDARGVPHDNPALLTILGSVRRLWDATRLHTAGGPAVVTISLHDRAGAVTEHVQNPGVRSAPSAPARGAPFPPSSIPGPTCASSP